MDADFLNNRITATKAQIVAIEDAVLAISLGSRQSYTIDTGQTVTTVTHLNLSKTQAVLDSLYNRCVMLEARLTGNGTTHVRPAF